MIPVRRVIGRVTVIENIAVGAKIRDVRRLQRLYGQGRWRKVKGLATVELADGQIRSAEIHYYEAHGVGRKDLKVKRFLDEP
ncbi:MAG TPA: hypothetical protein VEX60_01745 [Pyrinomonadaceae bacterium]|nr:hypothetical protein [Pyrinomonadaceae bacterium]